VVLRIHPAPAAAMAAPIWCPHSSHATMIGAACRPNTWFASITVGGTVATKSRP